MVLEYASPGKQFNFSIHKYLLLEKDWHLYLGYLTTNRRFQNTKALWLKLMSTCLWGQKKKKILQGKNNKTLVPNKWIIYPGSTKCLEIYLFIKKHQPFYGCEAGTGLGGAEQEPRASFRVSCISFGTVSIFHHCPWPHTPTGMPLMNPYF